MIPAELLRNPDARRFRAEAPDRRPLAFHRSLPGYAPTPLLDLAQAAPALGVGGLLVKDESDRLGLPAFKIAGASWAVVKALEAHVGRPLGADLGALRTALAREPRPVLAAATDGNHGRAVARMARLLDLPARIFVPADMVASRRAAIAAEGAELVVVAGGYDDAVARSAEEDAVVVSDTSWPGYEDVPRAVVEGYSTLLWEIDDELRRRRQDDPDAVLVPVGVGALAAAVVRHYRRPGLQKRPAIVAIEPTRAACVLASVRAGGPVTLEGVQDSIMSGLNCGTPSPVAWPLVSGGVDLFAAVDDDAARAGMRLLAEAGVVAGECGGAGVGALSALRVVGAGEADGLGPRARVLAFVTEGATDPAGYAAVVGRAPEAVAVRRRRAPG